MLSVARENLASAENLLRSLELEPRWFTQPANPRTFQSRLLTSQPVPVAELASALSKVAFAFEIDSDFECFLFHAGLGIKTLQKDTSGEFVIRFGQLEEIRRLAAGNRGEYERLLRLASGQSWLDMIEPLRSGSMALEGLRSVG